MKISQDKLWYGIVAALAVLLVAYVAFVNQPAPSTTTAPSTLGTNTQAVSPSTTTNPSTAPAPTQPAPTAKPLTYEQALTLYTGYRIQFVSCHGSPGTLNVTVGKKFMLDNRDLKAHTIVVGKASYRVGANGFAIATASSVAGTYNITCDGGGAATLTVQK